MRRDEGLAAGLFALVIGCAIAIAIVNDITAPLCAAAKGTAADKIDFGCLEFWLNRYQTTVQTLISGAIGGAGLYFVLKQLAALGHQNEMTRASLAATLESNQANRRLLIGKAVVALAAFKDVESYVTGFALNLLTKNHGGEFDFARIERAEALVPDIYPALFSAESRLLWREYVVELKILAHYVRDRSKGYTLADIRQVAFDENDCPDGDEDAAKRALAIGFQSIRLHTVLESNL